MVLEQLFKTKWVDKKPSISFSLAVVYTLISYIAASLIFRNAPHLIGITTIFLVVILAIPGINKLFAMEESKEARQKNFIKEHESLIDFFIYFFLGIFCVLLLISLFAPHTVFAKNDLLGINELKTVYNKDLPLPPTDTSLSLTILKNNLFVMLVLFLLSFFYSAGALFLIVLNASIFASSFTDAIKLQLPSAAADAFAYTMCNLGTRFIHTLPEVIAYFLVAIAGGVLSKAVTKEKLFSKRFYKVFKDAIILLGLSIVIIIFAALIEANLSFNFNICSNRVVLVLMLIVVASIIMFELKRKEKI